MQTILLTITIIIQIPMPPAPAPAGRQALVKKTRRTAYEVSFHFSTTSTETVRDKIKPLTPLASHGKIKFA